MPPLLSEQHPISRRWAIVDGRTLTPIDKHESDPASLWQIEARGL